ncbi:alpha/beta hydrolase [Aquincola sp. S2]|uniref:Alpha/beta hydrolase n=1 Tax=Pseudaquabacterium terrae TaxID=2732868 RepID=A0ABX2EP35_9BURK|nr:alpha/beta hydrolase [Aquabacterium terrae]NRF70411.1 alpha/beta hydrolase [Aquabacterium terrae]
MKLKYLLGGLLAVIVATGAVVLLSPLKALNVLAAVDSRRAAVGEAYGPLQRQRYDLYRPAGAQPAAGWPLVVFFYGGAWNRGERGDYRFVGEALAARGLMVMVADYRLHPEVRYPDFLHDCARALGFALERAASWQADPKRIFVMGHSAGAYNAAMLALDPRWLAAAGHRPGELAGWIGVAGPYDFLPIKTPEVQLVFHHPNVPADSQPIRHVIGSGVPALLAVGTGDQRVNPLRNSVGLAHALRDAGAPVALRQYDGVSHDAAIAAFAWPLRRLAPVLEDVVGFVQAPAAPRTMAALSER